MLMSTELPPNPQSCAPLHHTAIALSIPAVSRNLLELRLAQCFGERSNNGPSISYCDMELNDNSHFSAT